MKKECYNFELFDYNLTINTESETAIAMSRMDYTKKQIQIGETLFLHVPYISTSQALEAKDTFAVTNERQAFLSTLNILRQCKITGKMNDVDIMLPNLADIDTENSPVSINNELALALAVALYIIGLFSKKKSI